MKLYNLYQNIILEEIIKMVQLTEAVSPYDVDTVLNGDPNKEGKFYQVSFKYKEKDGTTSNRWVQIYQRNISTANNGLIDAYQISRDGKSNGINTRTGKEESFEGWRKFRLDKMSDFKVSKVAYYQPQAGFNKTGNNSPTVQSTQKIAPVGSYKYADTTLKNKAYAEKRAQQPQAQQQAQQQVQQPTKPTQVQQPVKQQVQQPVQQRTDLNNKEKEEEELNNV
jgi:hypothetical protein